MPDDQRELALASAAQINQLITDLWMAIERDAPRYQDFQLTGQQHAVLTLIAAGEDVTPRDLAEDLGVTKGAISQHLAGLEQAGYITRRRSDHDRRRQSLHLAARGEQYRATIAEFEAYLVSTYVARLSPADIAATVAALTTLKGAFEK